MEIANDGNRPVEGSVRVRVATRDDTRAITSLLQNAPHSHIHADWHYPVDWLGSPGFVVIDGVGTSVSSGSLSSRFFNSTTGINACFAAAADPSPAAWVRVAAVSETVNAKDVLVAMFAAVDEYLRETAVSQLGWLLVESWPQSWIRALGFEQIDSVGTFKKEGTDIPVIQQVPELRFRPAQAADLGNLEQIDINAFQPLWRNSETGFTLARRHAFSFDVVEYGGRVVGYQCSTLMRKGAHLSRISVDPSVQGYGVGSALLAHAVEGYRQRGVETITLNTQLGNLNSRRLYERFGFQPSGQQFPVWAIQY